MSGKAGEHPHELLALGAAGALSQEEEARLVAHLESCPACAQEAASWRRLASELSRLPAAQPARALVARTREAVEARLAERAERAWNRAALGFLIAFAWTMTVVGWLVVDLLAGGLLARFARPIGSTAAWYAVYLAAGWLSAGTAAVLLGRRAREEERTL